MCYPCTRIIHGRKIDIAELEHRFMHERGACGCDVKFPAMQGPQLVQPTWRAADWRETGETSAAGARASAAGSARPRHQHHRHPTAQQVPPTPSSDGNGYSAQSNLAGQGQGTAMPLYEEAQIGGNIAVSVRLSSLYAAEWTQDHAKLHESGQCKCPVRFEKYTPIDTSEDQDENAIPVPDSVREAQAAYMDDRIPVGHVGRWAMQGAPGSLLDNILGPIGPDPSIYEGRPVDIQTAQYHTEGIPIAGNPIAWGPPPESSGLPSIVEFGQPATTVAGLPLGAGPEGDSHAGDFETCSLYSCLERSPPPRRRRQSSEF
ncbi:hypothetical protein GGS24DRAFT_497704 [Hypoxylon argillaceum]|nr:hypothetical protein GGS24DRAFT_497704 [Hypoxylon argillaceum]